MKKRKSRITINRYTRVRRGRVENVKRHTRGRPNTGRRPVRVRQHDPEYRDLEILSSAGISTVTGGLFKGLPSLERRRRKKKRRASAHGDKHLKNREMDRIIRGVAGKHYKVSADASEELNIALSTHGEKIAIRALEIAISENRKTVLDRDIDRANEEFVTTFYRERVSKPW